MNAHFYRSLSLFTVSLITASVSMAADGELDVKSPFLPPGYGESTNKPAAKPKPTTNGPLARELEFRGLIQLNGTFQFSLFNKKENKGYWIKENEAAAHGIKVNSFNQDENSIIVNMNGRTERLTMMTATENPLPVKSSAPPVAKANRPKPSVLPADLQKKSTKTSNSRVIPRRRVILPKK